MAATRKRPWFVTEKRPPACMDGAFWRTPKERAVVGAPLLVSTIDFLAAAGDPDRQGHHVKALLRLLTSDLILDEIDGYESGALVAVLRLVQLVRLFWAQRDLFFGHAGSAHGRGRACGLDFRSATARRAGRHVGQGRGRRGRHCRGRQPGAGGTARRARGFCAAVRGAPGASDRPGCGRPHLCVGLFCRPWSRAPRAFRRRCCRPCKGCTRPMPGNFLPGGGLLSGWCAWPISAGPWSWRVRWPRPCQGPALPAITPETGASAGFTKNAVWTSCCGAKTAMHIFVPMWKYRKSWLAPPGRTCPFIVVATPVEEVGRDHDFDWAVLEPSSAQSLVQAAGRVNRHRFLRLEGTYNIAILQYNLRHCENCGKGRPGSRPLCTLGMKQKICMLTTGGTIWPSCCRGRTAV